MHGECSPERQTWPRDRGASPASRTAPRNVWIHGQKVRLNSPSLRCPQQTFIQLNPCFGRIKENQARSCQHFSYFQLKSLISELYRITNYLFLSSPSRKSESGNSGAEACRAGRQEATDSTRVCQIPHSIMCLPWMQTVSETRTG